MAAIEDANTSAEANGRIGTIASGFNIAARRSAIGSKNVKPGTRDRGGVGRGMGRHPIDIDFVKVGGGVVGQGEC